MRKRCSACVPKMGLEVSQFPGTWLKPRDLEGPWTARKPPKGAPKLKHSDLRAAKASKMAYKMLEKNKPKQRKWNLNFGVALRAPKNSQDRFKTNGCGRRNSPSNLIPPITRWPQNHDVFPGHPSLSNIWSFMRTCRRTATGPIRPTQNHLHSRIQETMQKPTAWMVRKPQIKNKKLKKIQRWKRKNGTEIPRWFHTADC